jgi:hypothetical protein
MKSPRFAPVLLLIPALAAAADTPPRDGAPLENLPLAGFVEVTSLEQLGNLVVTDTKLEQSADTVTQRIVVLRSEEIEHLPSPNRNLAELMRHTSGQFVNVLSRNDANWGSYAGLGPKYNSYLLDGLPIDAFVDAMSLDSAAIERVEVHKGPASVLYSNYLSMDFVGNQTPLAGTTNFVLKNRIDTPLTRFSAGAGAWGSYRGSAYTQGNAGQLGYILSAGHERSRLHPLRHARLLAADHPVATLREGQVLPQAQLRPRPPGPHPVPVLPAHLPPGQHGPPQPGFRAPLRHPQLRLQQRLRHRLAPPVQVRRTALRPQFRQRRLPRQPGPGEQREHPPDHPPRRPDPQPPSRPGRPADPRGGRPVGRLRDRRAQPGGSVSAENRAQARSTGYFIQEKIQLDQWILRGGDPAQHPRARLRSPRRQHAGHPLRQLEQEPVEPGHPLQHGARAGLLRQCRLQLHGPGGQADRRHRLVAEHQRRAAQPRPQARERHRPRPGHGLAAQPGAGHRPARLPQHPRRRHRDQHRQRRPLPGPLRERRQRPRPGLRAGCPLQPVGRSACLPT